MSAPPFETLVNAKVFASTALLGFASAQNYDMIYVSTPRIVAYEWPDLCSHLPLSARLGVSTTNMT